MKEYVKCLYYENACFDNPIVTVRDGQDRKHLTLEEVVGLLNEQQDTISQLQDLCGKSDYKNAKLRIKNKKLKEENEELRKENKDLNDIEWEKFKKKYHLE